MVNRTKANENLTEMEVARSLEILKTSHPKLVYERIFDLNDYIGRVCPKCHAPIAHCAFCGHRFPERGMMPPKRKADYEMEYEGIHYLLECKSSRAAVGFNTCFLKPHQVKSLVDNVMAGCKSYLLIANRSTRLKPILHILSIQEWLNVATNRRFIYWTEMEAIRPGLVRIPRAGKPFYVLEPLVNGL